MPPELTPNEREVAFALGKVADGMSIGSLGEIAFLSHRTLRSAARILGKLATKGIAFSRQERVFNQFPSPHETTETFWQPTTPALENWKALTGEDRDPC